MSPDAHRPRPSTRIRLSDERRSVLLGRLAEFYDAEFDETLSVYRAEQLLEFFVQALGPPLYNQAINDARGFMAGKLEDLNVEFYEPEDSGSRPGGAT